MMIEIDLSAASASEACSFIVWSPAEDAASLEHRKSIAAAEHLMTGVPAPVCDGVPASADTFLGQWL